MEWVTGEQKRKEAAEERSREMNTNQNEPVQLIKQEAHSVKQINMINRVNRSVGCSVSDLCRKAVVSLQHKSVSELLCLLLGPRPAPVCLGIWLMRLSAASTASLHHPSLLDGPLISGQREGRATIDTRLYNAVIVRVQSQKVSVTRTNDSAVKICNV